MNEWVWIEVDLLNTSALCVINDQTLIMHKTITKANIQNKESKKEESNTNGHKKFLSDGNSYSSLISHQVI